MFNQRPNTLNWSDATQINEPQISYWSPTFPSPTFPSPQDVIKALDDVWRDYYTTHERLATLHPMGQSLTTPVFGPTAASQLPPGTAPRQQQQQQQSSQVKVDQHNHNNNHLQQQQQELKPSVEAHLVARQPMTSITTTAAAAAPATITTTSNTAPVTASSTTQETTATINRTPIKQEPVKSQVEVRPAKLAGLSSPLQTKTFTSSPFPSTSQNNHNHYHNIISSNNSNSNNDPSQGTADVGSNIRDCQPIDSDQVDQSELDESISLMVAATPRNHRRLTDEERLRHKRERNRRAAANCRRRKDEKLRSLEEENAELRKTIESLRASLASLQERLRGLKITID